VYKGDLWRDHADGDAIAPGITVLRTPGHTEEDASLVVETAEGTYVLTHLWWLDDMTPETDPIAWKQEALDASRAKVVAIADWIFPDMAKRFRTHARGNQT
jgi:glyoxylase-like metal-dependent hydrolase (beta-lactamase superfamily II)